LAWRANRRRVKRDNAPKCQTFDVLKPFFRNGLPDAVKVTYKAGRRDGGMGMANDTRVIVLSSPKGGTGKSSLARHLLVSAVQNGCEAVGLDFDRQGSFVKWQARREKTRVTYPNFVQTEVIQVDLRDWRAALTNARRRTVVIVDTPPSVEDYIDSIYGLSKEADLVLIPTGTSIDDLDSVIPWMKALGERSVHAAFCLNKVNRRTNSFVKAKGRLLKMGAVSPVEIPTLEDIHVPAASGLSVLDHEKARGLEAFESLWDYVKREANL
jgi:chromosome partitioning protein